MTHQFGPALGTLRVPLRLIWPQLHRSYKPLLLIVSLGLASAFAETASIGMVLLLLSIIFAGGARSAVILESPLAGVLSWVPEALLQPAWAVAALFVFVVLRLALTASHRLVSSAFTLRIGHETRARLFRSIVNMPFERSQAQSWGELYSVVDEHSRAVPQALEAVCKVVHALTVLAVVGLLLMIAAPLLALIGIGAVVTLNRAMARLRKPVEQAGEDYVRASRSMSEEIIRTLHALRTFRVLGLAERQSRRFEVASGRSAQAQQKSVILAILADPASQIIALTSVTIMALSSELLGLGAGTLLLAVGLLYRLEPYAAQLEDGLMTIVERTPALQLVASIPDPCPITGAKPIRDEVGIIRLENVSFAYGSRSKPVLDGLDIVIPRGGWTLIEGGSGAGKSTLVNLLLGLLQPTAGQVTVDGRALRDIEPSSWRRRVAVCGQDIELISGSVRDNILLGSRAASEQALEQAIDASGLGQIVAELPQGLDTDLGERSIQFSGGQRQRLAVARAILRRPSVLILDEATSMLDKASQARIFAELYRIMEGGTVIVIGHNLADLPPIKARFSLASPDASSVGSQPQAGYGRDARASPPSGSAGSRADGSAGEPPARKNEGNVPPQNPSTRPMAWCRK